MRYIISAFFLTILSIYFIKIVKQHSSGEVSERPKEHGWKPCVAQVTGGSNPPLSEELNLTEQVFNFNSALYLQI